MKSEWISAALMALSIIGIVVLFGLWIYIIYMAALGLSGLIFGSTAWYYVIFLMIMIAAVFAALVSGQKKA